MLRRTRNAGFTLIEAMIVLGTVSVTILGILTTHITCARLNQVTHETTLGSEAIRSRMEQIAATDVAQVIAMFDEITANDPGGPSTAPGDVFIGTGLAADSLARRGSVEMPLDGAGNLREDLVLPQLGMPRDLNGDGVVDALNHQADFQVLPVIVRLRWKGISGDREMRLSTVLHR